MSYASQWRSCRICYYLVKWLRRCCDSNSGRASFATWWPISPIPSVMVCFREPNHEHCLVYDASFLSVVFHLLKNGDKQDEAQGNKVRQDAILSLCQMNPSEIISVRNKCIEWCRMPSLLLLLTLQQQTQRHGPDLVSCMSGLLLGSDPQIRSWISFFVRNGQKQNPALKAFRTALLAHLRELIVVLRTPDSKAIVHQNIVRASALLRLYTALRGIAGMK